MKLKGVEILGASGIVPCQGLTFEFVAPDHCRFLSIIWALPANRLEFATKLEELAEIIELTPDLDGEETCGFGVR